MLMQGSILMEVTRRPQCLRMVPTLEAMTPFPIPEITPPVTKMYFIFPHCNTKKLCHSLKYKVRYWISDLRQRFYYRKRIDHSYWIALMIGCGKSYQQVILILIGHKNSGMQIQSHFSPRIMRPIPLVKIVQGQLFLYIFRGHQIRSKLEMIMSNGMLFRMIQLPL